MVLIYRDEVSGWTGGQLMAGAALGRKERGALDFADERRQQAGTRDYAQKSTVQNLHARAAADRRRSQVAVAASERAAGPGHPGEGT